MSQRAHYYPHRPHAGALRQRTRLDGAEKALHFYAMRGMRIVAARGPLRITHAPFWLGEQMIVQELVVCEGDAHVAQRAGWIAVSAQTEAAVLCSETMAQARLAAPCLRLPEAGLTRLGV